MSDHVCSACNDGVKFSKLGFIDHCRQMNDIKHNHLLFNESNVDDWTECHECTYRSATLRNHVVDVHNMTTDEYKQKYGKYSLVSNNYLAKLRKSGNKATETKDSRVYSHKCKYDDCENIIDGHNLICDSCKIKDIAKQKEVQRQKLEEKFKGLIEGQDFVRCRICRWPDTRISEHVLNEHGLDKYQYKTKFGSDTSLVCEKSKDYAPATAETKKNISMGHIKRNKKKEKI